MWIDAHNHLQDARLGDDTEALIASMRRAGIAGCVVNATCEKNWQDVAALADKEPDFIRPAYGIHPWHAHTTQVGWQNRLKDLLENNANSSVGECGLDQWVTQPTIHTQFSVFLDQLRIAREMDRPVTIHCLKAWAPLMAAFAVVPPPSRFLIHSFVGSIEMARRLIPLGAYFSFSGYFLHPRKSSVLEVFKKLPHDRILLETDAPDMRPPSSFISHPLLENINHPANLVTIGHGLASALKMDTTRLAELTRENTLRCFAS
jgi:TatD DNase family protein